MEAPKTPNCDRWNRVFDKAIAIIQFLNWMSREEGSAEGDFNPPGDTPVFLACYENDGNQIWPIRGQVDHHVMRFFGVDPVEIEKERRASLEYLQWLNTDRQKSDVET